MQLLPEQKIVWWPLLPTRWDISAEKFIVAQFIRESACPVHCDSCSDDLYFPPADKVIEVAHMPP
jgi:hypothetical protein